MTINIGWHFNGHVYLIADTAVTDYSSPKPYASTTTFSEATIQEKSGTIEERHMKIVPLGTHAAAAISGCIGPATAFINELKRERNPNLAEAVLEVANGRRTSEHAAFNLLIGSHLAASTQLLHFSSKSQSITAIPELLDLPADQTQPSIAEEATLLLRNVVIEGSAGHDLKHLMQLVATIASVGDEDAHRALIGTVGLLQSQGIINYLLETGVGGAMFGAFINKHGLQWQPDVTFQIYGTLAGAIPVDSPDELPAGEGPLDQQPDFVSCAVRDGVGYVSSSFHPTGRILVLSPFEAPAISSDVEQMVLSSLPQRDTPFYVCINSKLRDVIVVDRREEKEKHIMVRSGDVLIDEVLMDELSRSADNGPARITFLR
jgi:hypothetical protein